ncbi:MAG: ATP-binding protein [Armatimonadota bacterium]
MELNAISGFNPWWTDSSFRFSEEGIVNRPVMDKFDKYIDVPQIISVLGLRRSGKTTILKHYINKLLNAGNIPDKIFFFSFEDYLGKNEPEILESIINTYLNKYLQEDIYQIKDKLYIFLDEIQYIEHWQDILKRFYDKNKNIKFIISGSFSAVIKRKSTESLAGRIFEITVPLFSFYEYCLLKNAPINFKPLLIKEALNITTIGLNDIDKIQQLYGDKIEPLYNEYLYKGQFPEAALFHEEDLVVNYIRGSILKKVLTEDAPKVFKIDKIGEFSSLYKIISKETGSLFELLNLAREVGINKDTLNNYLYYLDHLFLLKLIYNYTGKVRKQYRIQKKIYIASPNFTCNELNISCNSSSFPMILGPLVETVVFQLLNNQYREIFFWKQRQKEVDFIIEDQDKIIPIEVKYVNKILPRHLSNLVYFMKRNELHLGLVATKNKAGITFIEDRKIIFIPVWALL